MRKKTSRFVSSMVAFAMMFTTMFTNVSFVNADDAVAAADEVVSESAISVLSEEEAAEDDAVEVLANTFKTADAAGVTLYDNDKVTVVSGQQLSLTDKGAAEVGGVNYEEGVMTSSKNSKITLDTVGSNKNYRVVCAVTAKADVTLTFNHRIGSGKANYVFTSTDLALGDFDSAFTGVTVAAYSADDGTYSSDSIDVASDTTVYFAGQGTNPYFYDILVDGVSVMSEEEEDSSTTTTESTTESTTAADDTTTTETDTTTTEADAETTTEGSENVDSAAFEVSASKAEFEEEEIGDTFTVDFNLTANPGIANITGWIYYNPSVVQAIEPVDEADDAYVTYTNADGETVRLFTKTAVSNAINVTKSSFTTGEYDNFVDYGDDATAAEMGALKLANYINAIDENTGLEGTADNTGKLMSITFKVIGTGSTDIEFMPTLLADESYDPLSYELTQQSIVVNPKETTTEGTTVDADAPQVDVVISGASVEGNYTYKVDQGATISAQILLKNIENVGALEGNLLYDASVIKPVDAHTGNLFATAETKITDETASSGSLKVVAMAGEDDVDADGNVVGVTPTDDNNLVITVDFTAVAAGTSDVTFNITELSGDYSNSFADISEGVEVQKAVVIVNAVEDTTTTEATSETTTEADDTTTTEADDTTTTEADDTTTTETDTETTTESDTETTTETTTEGTTLADPEVPDASAMQYDINVIGGTLLSGTNNTYTFSSTTQEFTVEVALKNNQGVTAITGYLDYDPTVIQAVTAQAVSNDEGIAYTDPDGQTSQIITRSTVQGQIDLVPSAENADYTDLGSDGVKTAAELGRVKLSGAGLTWIDNGVAQAVAEDGLIARITFKVVSSDANAQSLISYTDIGTAAANGNETIYYDTLPSNNKVVTVNYVSSVAGDVFAGDVNADGMLTSDDSAMILSYSLNPDSQGFTANQIKVGNVTGSFDEEQPIDTEDASEVLSKALDADNVVLDNYADGIVSDLTYEVFKAELGVQ